MECRFEHLRVGSNWATRASLVVDKRGDSCLISTGEALNAFTPDTFKSLLATYPQATLNSTTMYYEVPCDQRFNASNIWSFTISDPRNRENSITIEMPSTQTIWPSHLVVNGGDPNTCSIAANTFEVVAGGAKYKCALGAAFLKSTYMVLDMGNVEVSIAKVANGHSNPDIEAISEEGIRELYL